VVARRVGPGRFLTLTLITTVAAAATHLYVHWGSQTPVVGASGFVSGLMGGAARFIFIDPRGTTVWPRPVLPLFSRPVITFALLFTMINLGYGLSGFAPDGFERSVAWEAHLGGFYVGLIVFPLFDRQRGWLR
jgi:membrane associated rhomboid family serine protease